MSLTPDNCNFNGSGIAWASGRSTGLRIVVSLYYELERQARARVALPCASARAHRWLRCGPATSKLNWVFDRSGGLKRPPYRNPGFISSSHEITTHNVIIPPTKTQPTGSSNLYAGPQTSEANRNNRRQTGPAGLYTGRRVHRRIGSQRKNLQVRTQELQNERNTRSKTIGRAKASGQDIQPLLNEIASLGDNLKQAENVSTPSNPTTRSPTGNLNTPHGTPSGSRDSDNVEIRRWESPANCHSNHATMWTWARRVSGLRQQPNPEPDSWSSRAS